jgi:hypothetical protein
VQRSFLAARTKPEDKSTAVVASAIAAYGGDPIDIARRIEEEPPGSFSILWIRRKGME